MKYLLFILLSCNILFAQPANDIGKTISGSEMMETIKVLCSDEYAGRLPGDEGYNKAAEYMAGEFSKIGLKKINGSYFQKLSVEYNKIFSPVVFNLSDEKGNKKEYSLGKDFVCRGFTGSGNVNAEIVFCGYGTDTAFYSDYKGVDVKGKIVMIFKPNPAWKKENNEWPGGYPRQKSNTAAKFGAAGIIMVSTPNAEDPQRPVASVLHGDGIQEENIPQIHVELNVAEEILKNSGYTLKELQRIIDSTKSPFSFPLKTRAELSVKAEYHKSAETMNVWGLLEGSDPVLKNEYLIIGAHLDHVGKQGDVIFRGALDNASGSAAVLEIARQFVKNNIKPRRSVIFALFASEEQGLYGATYMAQNLPVKNEAVTAMFNLDCIAVGDSVQVGNGKSAPSLWQLAKNLDAITDKYMVRNTWNGGGADASPFHEKNIPCLYFVSTNGYKNIHTMYDTPESLNPLLMEKVARLAFLTAVKVSLGDYKREIPLK